MRKNTGKHTPVSLLVSFGPSGARLIKKHERYARFLFLSFHSITLQIYEKMCKAKKTETTNNAGASARESGTDLATDVPRYV
jgi:hypothetical protein